MATFIDDNGKEVLAVTAEQHALDNIGHIVVVHVNPERTEASGHLMLELGCANCSWWNEEGFR